MEEEYYGYGLSTTWGMEEISAAGEKGVPTDWKAAAGGKYALGNQIRRAVTSIVLNIAEGTGRNSDKELRYFLTVACGSTAEVEAQLLICVELGFFSEQDAASAL